MAQNVLTLSEEELLSLITESEGEIIVIENSMPNTSLDSNDLLQVLDNSNVEEQNELNLNAVTVENTSLEDINIIIDYPNLKKSEVDKNLCATNEISCSDKLMLYKTPTTQEINKTDNDSTQEINETDNDFEDDPEMIDTVTRVAGGRKRKRGNKKELGKKMRHSSVGKNWTINCKHDTDSKYLRGKKTRKS